MNFGIQNIIFIVILIAAFAFLFYNIKRLISYLKIAKPDHSRFENIGKRIALTIGIAFGQSKILRDKSAGPLHAGIFWGFLILLFSAIQSILEGIGINHPLDFLGYFYTAVSFVTDFFLVIVFFAVLFALIRRFVIKVERLQGDKSEKNDAALILVMILIVVTSIMLQNVAAISLQVDSSHAFRPIAEYKAQFISADTAGWLYPVMWWVHILAIFFFMNYLPYSKHLHVYTSIPNVFFSTLGPANKLEPIDFEEEGVEKFGVVDIEDFSWKSIFDSYSCTHCGRCTSVCPANQTGKELSPREVIVQIRERTMETAEAKLKLKDDPENTVIPDNQKTLLEKALVGDYESVDALWQCTTCGACMQECPINIEHVPAIIGMRRNLVMMEANFSPQLQTAFTNLENNATPWAFSGAERAEWAEGAEIQKASENPEFEYLFWVGCAGSFDDRAKKISLAFAKLLKKAGVSFAILGEEEQCNGDIARRSGHEFLADMLIKANVETLKNYDVKKIITICPHCFNTFKNEYPDFGLNVEVVHHSQFLLQLVNEGKLKLKSDVKKINAAYHDSCYLGRYNEIYNEPRKLLEKSGINVLEARRHDDRGFCCGAGGGQMFMEETVGKRVNIERTEELLDTKADTIALNCPFCMTMITDGVKSKGLEDVEVRDIAEILLDSVE